MKITSFLAKRYERKVRQGKSERKSGVYKLVNEHFESFFNAANADLVNF
jgi:hypothetical protein